MGCFIEYQNSVKEKTCDNSQPDWINVVLCEYEDVFREPSRLPPRRRHEHAIILKKGANIPNLRP